MQNQVEQLQVLFFEEQKDVTAPFFHCYNKWLANNHQVQYTMTDLQNCEQKNVQFNICNCVLSLFDKDNLIVIHNLVLNIQSKGKGAM